MILVRDMLGLGGAVAAVGLQHIFMAIPTICLLPYRQYLMLHGYNIFLSLVIMITGIQFFKTTRKFEHLILFNKPANINLAVRLSLFLAACTVTLTLYGFGVGPKFDSEGLFHQVLAEARHPEWGRCVQLAENEVTALLYLYQFISMSHSFNIFTVLTTVIVAVVNWDRYASLHSKEDDIVGTKIAQADIKVWGPTEMMPVIVEEDEKVPVFAVPDA